MNQQIYDGIMNVLQRGSGVMAQEYCQAFSAVVAELQRRIQEENAVKSEEVKKNYNSDSKKVKGE